MGEVVILIFMSGDHPIRMVAESSAELARLLAEPGFAAALRAAWGGAGSLDDAVHWRQHPLTTAPSGRSDPAAKLGELRARVYARPLAGQLIVETTDAAGASVRLGQSEARLLLLEQQLMRDAEVLDHAISAARQALEGRESRTGVKTSSETVVPDIFASMLRRHPTLVFSVAATVLVVLVIPSTAIAFAPSLTPSAGLLRVFDRPQAIIDIAPRTFSGGQPGSTQRVRDTTRFLGFYYGVRVFAYRNTPDEVCMLTTAAGDRDVTVCATVRSFARSGLSIAPVNYHQNYGKIDAAAGVTAASRLAFRWGPDSGLAVRVIG